jgi:dCTP deaminase
MSVLTKSEIWEELSKGVDGVGLVITPLVNAGKEIGTSAVDLHLGHEFIVFRRAKATSLNVQQGKNVEENVHLHQQKQRMGPGQKFVLHPHQLVLGASVEYISLPGNLAGDIKGRSTWGRTGLVIATATKIDPGFKGCVTLELVNEGEIPLVLYPGLCVAQLVLFRTGKVVRYAGRYHCPTGPEFPKLYNESKALPRFYRPIE